MTFKFISYLCSQIYFQLLIGLFHLVIEHIGAKLNAHMLNLNSLNFLMNYHPPGQRYLKT